MKKTTVLHATAKPPDYADLPTSLQYFSDWHRARKAVALCLRYIRKLKDRCFKRDKAAVKGTQALTVGEICEAEKVILRATQQRYLPESYRLLKRLGTYPAERQQSRLRLDKMKNESNLFRLDPYMDTDELIRVGGRIRRASVSRELAHPIIVPKGHIAGLLVEFFHRKVSHSGRSTTLNEIRAAGYWILRGRSLVNSIINKCVVCRKLRFPAAAQKMADLPPDRMETAAPFTYSGVDYFGPFLH